MADALSHLLVLAVLLVFSAFFSASETAIFSLSKLEKKRLQGRHPRTWKTIEQLLIHPRRTLITILIGNMAVNTLAIAIATSMAITWFGPKGIGWTIAVFTLVLDLTGEVTPKVFAVRHNEFVAFLFARPLDVIARLLFPIRRLVRLISDWVLSFLVRGRQTDADLVSESELKALARIGEEEGVLKPGERKMIQKLIGLGERIAREIMTPRPDLITFNLDLGRDELVRLLRQYHFSHMPVYQGSLDHLLGVISTREFMLHPQKKLEEFILPPYYVPETKPVDELFEEFERRNTHFAICVDEHGGTAGLVTLEDILEEIFGEFHDEHSREEPAIKEIGHNRYLVQGKMGLHQLNDALGVSLESGESETLSGWLLQHLGRIPNSNELVRWRGVDFLIKEVHRQRILKVEIHKKR